MDFELCTSRRADYLVRDVVPWPVLPRVRHRVDLLEGERASMLVESALDHRGHCEKIDCVVQSGEMVKLTAATIVSVVARIGFIIV